MSGSIPTHISALRGLTTLDLENNILSGSLPTSVTLLTNLQQLSAGGNELKGSIPPAIVNFTNLKILELDRNQMQGTVPDLSGLRFLEKLDLKTNKFSGSVPVLPNSLQICDLGTFHVMLPLLLSLFGLKSVFFLMMDFFLLRFVSTAWNNWSVTENGLTKECFQQKNT